MEAFRRDVEGRARGREREGEGEKRKENIGKTDNLMFDPTESFTVRKV